MTGGPGTIATNQGHVPRPGTRFARLAAALLCLVAFVAVAFAVADGATIQADVTVLVFAADRHALLPDLVMGMLSLIGGGKRLSLLTAILLAALIARGRYGNAWFVATGFVGAEVSSAAVKAFVDRTRPAEDYRAAFTLPGWVDEALIGLVALAVVAAWPTRWRRPALLVAGFFGLAVALDLLGEAWIPTPRFRDSFPSGHALRSAAFLGSVILVFWTSRWRRSLLLFGAAFLAAVGASRVYLGVHYPSDVLGGWTLAFSGVLALSLVPFLDPLRPGAAATADEARDNVGEAAGSPAPAPSSTDPPPR